MLHFDPTPEELIVNRMRSLRSISLAKIEHSLGYGLIPSVRRDLVRVLEFYRRMGADIHSWYDYDLENWNEVYPID